MGIGARWRASFQSHWVSAGEFEEVAAASDESSSSRLTSCPRSYGSLCGQESSSATSHKSHRVGHLRTELGVAVESR
jgi:hypothetical protein